MHLGSRVLFVAAEALPLAKTGGLGDVVSALAVALGARGAEITLLLPGYPQALDEARSLRQIGQFDDLPGGSGQLLCGRMPDSELGVVLLRMDHLYRRAGNPYQDENGFEFPDNAVRFAALSQAGARISDGQSRLEAPDIVHAHDWHAGLTPLYMRRFGAHAVPSMLTIHNLAFQGNFPLEVAPAIDVDAQYLGSDGIEFWGQLSFLKAGIRYADRITTVSHSYAEEILTPEFGCGLEGLLSARRDRLSAVPNGIDTVVWDPSRDPMIAATFSAGDMKGKLACKRALQQTFGLHIDPFAPLLGLGSRLTEQKMGDVACAALDQLLRENTRLQVAVLGSGDPTLENRLRELAQRYPGRAGVIIGYDEKTAHGLHAGADMLLHGSRFEPFGLTPIYAMRYGTVPIASRVGGLIDTIVDRGTEQEPQPGASGFLFDGDAVEAMVDVIRRALVAFETPRIWRALQQSGMRGDYGWDTSAQRYVDLYHSMTEDRPNGSFKVSIEEFSPVDKTQASTAKKRA